MTTNITGQISSRILALNAIAGPSRFKISHHSLSKARKSVVSTGPSFSTRSNRRITAALKGQPGSCPSHDQSRGYAIKTPLNTGGTSGGVSSPIDYCASLVKKLDPDAALCSYFWPKKEREWFLAWRAFNIELHLITATVTQPALAAIRFQFWRDALSSIFSSDPEKQNKVPQQPITLSLAEMKRERPIQKYYLSQMIDVRAKNLSLPPSSPTLQTHLDTYSPLSTSLLLGPLPLLIPPTHPKIDSISHTLSHISTLLTIVSLLRNFPILVQSKRQSSVPSDISAKYGIVDEQVFREGGSAKGLKDGLYEIGTRGMDELITARREVGKMEGGKIEQRVRPLFLSAIPAERYLKRLEQHDFDVFHPDLQKQDWKLAPTIWWRYQTGKI